MAVSGKYGHIEISAIGKDEPVFILRAQDKLAEYAIEMYEQLALSHGYKTAGSIRREIERFRKWNGVKKLPD
jgi:hypothetical protein